MAVTSSILRLSGVEARTGVDRRTLYAWMDRGLFPRPIKLGPRMVGWLETDIATWLDQRIAETRGQAHD